MMGGTIYYLIPDNHRSDFSLRRWIRAIKNGRGIEHCRKFWFRRHKPIGGIKIIYQHYMLLRELGIRVELVRMGRYEGNFFGFPVVPKKIGDIGYKLESHDLVIVPEHVAEFGRRFDCGKKILFVQNWLHLYKAGYEKGYCSNGYDAVLYCSEYLKEKLDKEPEQGLFLINNFIDLQRFRPDPAVRVPGRVMALPRKNPADLDKIMELMAGFDCEFRLVDGLTEEEIIREYQQADIFLATGYPEGFGLPPLEAMACGAAVVGFTGGGAREFMVDDSTALTVGDGDVEGAAQALKRVLGDDQLKERLRLAGMGVAKEYHVDRTRQQLADYFAGLAEEDRF